MDPKIKLFLLIIISTLTLLMNELILIMILFFSVITIVLILRIQSKLFKWIKPILIVCILIILIDTFTYSPIKFTIEGLIFGFKISLRLLTLLIMVFTFISTTTPKQLLESFSFLPRDMALMLTIAFRLLPIVEDGIIKIVNAQKARGLDFKSLNPFKTYFPVLVPLFGKTLEGSYRLALAMESRGFEGK